jgi:hypothetical protein
MFKINWVNVKSAIVYGILTAILAMLIYAIGVNDVFKLDWRQLLNSGVFGFLVVIVSLIKNLLTTNDGKFLWITTVIPDKK